MYLVLTMERKDYWQSIIIISLRIITMIFFLFNIILNYIGFIWLQKAFGQTSILFGLMGVQHNSNHDEHGTMLHNMCTFHHITFNYF